MKRKRFSVRWPFSLLVVALFSLAAVVSVSPVSARERREVRTIDNQDTDNQGDYDNPYDVEANKVKRITPRTTKPVTTQSVSRPGSLRPVGEVTEPGDQPDGGDVKSGEPGGTEKRTAPWEERRRKILESKANPEDLAKAQEMLEQHLERVREARQKEVEQAGGAPATSPQGMGYPGGGHPGSGYPGGPRPGAAPSSPNPPIFNPPVGLDTITLYLDPPEKVCLPGQTFAINIQLENPQRKSFDEIGFALGYNKNILRALDGDGNLPGLNLCDQFSKETFPWKRGEGSPGYENRIDSVAGLILYTARWDEKSPLEASGTIASVTFEMIAPAETTIEFVFSNAAVESKGPLTRVWMGGQDALGAADVAADGVSGGRVRSYSMLAEGTSVDGHPMPVSGESKDYSTLVVIHPSKEYVRPGEEFDIVIDIENPDKVQFDELMLFLGYNRKYLLALDHDAGNRMSNGINVFDGDYHGAFPFNLYKINRVDTEQGTILYHMGSLKTRLNGSGTVASIRFRALRPTARFGSRIQVGFLKGRYETGLFYQGEDVLKSREESGDGFVSDPVSILPMFASTRGE